MEKFKTWVIKAVETMIRLLVVILALTIVEIVVNSVIAIFTAGFGPIVGTVMGVLFCFGVIYLLWIYRHPISVDIKVKGLQDEEEEIVTEPI